MFTAGAGGEGSTEAYALNVFWKKNKEKEEGGSAPLLFFYGVLNVFRSGLRHFPYEIFGRENWQETKDSMVYFVQT